MQSTRIFLGLGSNLGDRQQYLEEALLLLSSSVGRLVAVSSVFETAPVGPVLDQPPFLNAVAMFDSELLPLDIPLGGAARALALLEGCLAVEQALGRQRRIDKGPRTIDIDVLLYGEQILDHPRLTLPHPELHDRAFVLRPLLQLDATLRHPRNQRLLSGYLEQLGQSQMLVEKLHAWRTIRPCASQLEALQV